MICIDALPGEDHETHLYGIGATMTIRGIARSERHAQTQADMTPKCFSCVTDPTSSNRELSRGQNSHRAVRRTSEKRGCVILTRGLLSNQGRRCAKEAVYVLGTRARRIERNNTSEKATSAG